MGRLLLLIVALFLTASCAKLERPPHETAAAPQIEIPPARTVIRVYNGAGSE
jgi:hypothetical protein